IGTQKIWNTLLSLSGLWRKRYAVLKESYKLYRRKILTVCKTSLPRNMIISFPEESGQGQVLEMGMNLSGEEKSVFYIELYFTYLTIKPVKNKEIIKNAKV
ncbi:MAG: hypothetical protein ABRQ38_29110, partial [Candidatus Eremiobacterota bacterium]